MGFVHTVRRFAGLHEGLSDWHSMDLTMSCSSDCIFGCLIGQQSTFTVDTFLFVESKCTTSAWPWALHQFGQDCSIGQKTGSWLKLNRVEPLSLLHTSDVSASAIATQKNLV